MENLLECIQNRDIPGFIAGYDAVKSEMDESQKQELLTQIVAFYFDDKDFEFFRKVLDTIIGESLNLDFHTEHWAPSFLALSVHVVSQKLFDYLLSMGADINFVGDPYAYEDDDYIRNELKLEDRGYATCLDFAGKKLTDMMGDDYHYQLPDWKGIDQSWSEMESGEEITMNKRYYAYILEQAQYLYDLVYLNKLIDHIRKAGGKSYEELA